MQRSWLSRTMLCLLMLSVTACAGSFGDSGSGLVQEAYNTSNMVKVKPYTRTIFSSTDF